jgi:hypothetical protein
MSCPFVSVSVIPVCFLPVVRTCARLSLLPGPGTELIPHVHHGPSTWVGPILGQRLRFFGFAPGRGVRAAGLLLRAA